MNFNTSFNDKGEKPRFISKPNPLVERSYQIFEFKLTKKNYEPVGDYVVLDTEEAPDIADKKVFNLIRLLNGKRDLQDLGNLTKSRLLFNVVPRSSAEERTKVIFRKHDGKGVSKENAVFTIEKGIFDESK